MADKFAPKAGTACTCCGTEAYTQHNLYAYSHTVCAEIIYRCLSKWLRVHTLLFTFSFIYSPPIAKSVAK